MLKSVRLLKSEWMKLLNGSAERKEVYTRDLKAIVIKSDLGLFERNVNSQFARLNDRDLMDYSRFISLIAPAKLSGNQNTNKLLESIKNRVLSNNFVWDRRNLRNFLLFCVENQSFAISLDCKLEKLFRVVNEMKFELGLNELAAVVCFVDIFMRCELEENSETYLKYLSEAKTLRVLTYDQLFWATKALEIAMQSGSKQYPSTSAELYNHLAARIPIPSPSTQPRILQLLNFSRSSPFSAIINEKIAEMLYEVLYSSPLLQQALENRDEILWVGELISSLTLPTYKKVYLLKFYLQKSTKFLNVYSENYKFHKLLTIATSFVSLQVENKTMNTILTGTILNAIILHFKKVPSYSPKVLELLENLAILNFSEFSLKNKNSLVISLIDKINDDLIASLLNNLDGMKKSEQGSTASITEQVEVGIRYLWVLCVFDYYSENNIKILVETINRHCYELPDGLALKLLQIENWFRFEVQRGWELEERFFLSKHINNKRENLRILHPTLKSILSSNGYVFDQFINNYFIDCANHSRKTAILLFNAEDQIECNEIRVPDGKIYAILRNLKHSGWNIHTLKFNSQLNKVAIIPE